MKWGRCPELGEAIENLFTSGGASGTWDAGAGTFEASLPAGGACGGTTGSVDVSLELTFGGCGKIRITVAGDGPSYSAGQIQAHVIAGGTYHCVMWSAGGGASCTPAPLTLDAGANPVEIDVICGSSITLYFGGSNLNAPEVDCTFTLELIP